MHDPYETDDGNPYASPREIVEESGSVSGKPGCTFFLLLILAAPICLWCIRIYFKHWDKLRNVFAFGLFNFLQDVGIILFPIAYIGMLFKKNGAFWLTTVITMVWTGQVVYYLRNANPDPNEPGLVMFFTALYVVFAIYSAMIGLLAFHNALINRSNKHIDKDKG